MANIKVLRATDPFVLNSHAFSIVASDSKVEYVFPSKSNLFDRDGALKFALGYYGKKPKKADDWLNVAKFNLDSYNFSPANIVEDSVVEFEDYVAYEQEALDDKENNFVQPKSVSNLRMERAVQALMSSDDEIADWLVDQTTEISDEKRKLIIATLIAAAGTTDLNPWLMPWLNGETNLDAMGFNGIVLSRPFNTQDMSLDAEAHRNYVEGESL